MSYPFKEIESKWQKIWEEKKIYEARDDFSKKKIYILIEFPYPSAQGLHVGHPRSYTALDILARKRRMEGF
jgi:leucyl-tRNA synthetase